MINTLSISLLKECFQNMKLSKNLKKNQCPINCAQCENQLGFLRTYKNRMLPNMNLKDLSFICDNETKTYRNWKDVPLDIPEIHVKELLTVSQKHSLSQ